ncbi:hypothetical protein JCM5350_002250 [Sporobolomyces pararoseus]
MHFSLSSVGVILASLATLAVAAKPDQVFDGNSAHTLLAWFPPITRPAGGEVYEAGSTQVASWNRALPIGFNLTQVGKHADLLLGYSLPDVLNYHLDVTLVKNISLYEGAAEVTYTVPDLPERTSYFLALVGSSSNISPEFTIKAASPSTSPSTDPLDQYQSPPIVGEKRLRKKRQENPFGLHDSEPAEGDEEDLVEAQGWDIPGKPYVYPEDGLPDQGNPRLREDEEALYQNLVKKFSKARSL